MSGQKYVGRIDHLVAVAAEAGFAGLEPELVMLGAEYADPSHLAETLAEQGMRLAGIAYIADWLHAEETPDERAEADECLRLLKHFGGGKLVMVPVPLSGDGGSPLEVRQRHGLSCMNAVARRAREVGIHATVHPNSSPDSAFRTREDYEVLFAALDRDIGFTPDVGHIAAGGMDPLETIKQYRTRVDHVHFKDIHEDGTWAQTGEGRLDFPGIVSHLHETGFDGWIIFEDESSFAESEPDDATRRNGDYARTMLLPILGVKT
jgi:inosose dehydratase